MAVAIGDFNGDGIPDAAIADISDSQPRVNVLLGNGDGTFRSPVSYQAGQSPVYVATADFNGDGNLDLAVVDILMGVNILLGNGNGTFQPLVTYPVGPDPISIAIADFNRDGKADLAVPSVQGVGQDGAFAIVLGNGDGSFQPPVPYPAGVSPNSVAVGDLNGDGILDVVVGNGTPSLAVLLGNGDGTFQPATRYGGLGLAAHWVALGDFNGDGKLDVAAVLPATGNLKNSQLVVGLGNGDGTFAPPKLVLAGRGLAGVAVSDFNHDGFDDLAIAEDEVNLGRVIVLMSNGDGTFQTAQAYRTPNGSLTVATADLNGDGNADLVVVNQFASSISVLLNTGAGAKGGSRYAGKK